MNYTYSKMGKDWQGNKLDENYQFGNTLIQYKGRVYSTGNRYHDLIELFNNGKFVVTVPMQHICLVKEEDYEQSHGGIRTDGMCGEDVHNPGKAMSKEETKQEMTAEEFVNCVVNLRTSACFMTEGDTKELHDEVAGHLRSVMRGETSELLKQRDELREALIDMVDQFAYCFQTTTTETLGTGGLSALESAFSALGISDPITVIDFEAAIKNTEG